MEQSSNVQYRAEKEYKNSREKFHLLLREIISNSIHAVLIRQTKEKNYSPKISLDVQLDETKCDIVLKDNGEGFTKKNKNYFEKLDSENEEKKAMNFHPLGQGRLAIVYFSDYASYESVYKNDNGEFKKRIVNYPFDSDKIYGFDLFDEIETDLTDSYTTLKINIYSHNCLSRANTFFNKNKGIEELKQWFIETFFPFIINNENLEIELKYNGMKEIVKKDSVETDTECLTFLLPIKNLDETEREYSFKLWLIKSNNKILRENYITCFARNLKAELSEGKLLYILDNDKSYLYYLTSDFFDDNVDTKGEKIELNNAEMISLINEKISQLLDEKFNTVIKTNKISSEKTYETFKKEFPSLENFIDVSKLDAGKIIQKKEDLIHSAISEKGRIEKAFWTSKNNEDKDEKENFEDTEDCQKLLNSSLQIYVKHRERVLEQLHSLIQLFDSEGNDKPELESKVHELFFKRGTTLSESNNINHLHNLWILDDKFTIFSNNFKAQSTKQGQAATDIYIWADDPEKTKQILILELKSTTKAHNAGKSEGGMIAQVKGYAQDFYNNPNKIINWSVNTDEVQYIGIILARKTDINKELTSNNVGVFNKIPFLENSYYADEVFSKNSNKPMDRMNIRIELYSFEDIYELASSRNEVFFKLLDNEFGIDNEGEV